MLKLRTTNDFYQKEKFFVDFETLSFMWKWKPLFKKKWDYYIVSGSGKLH
jgi:hypothetical protein